MIACCYLPSVDGQGWNRPFVFRERNEQEVGFASCDVKADYFAAPKTECMELAQTKSSPEKRALYLKMACVWHQMAQRWEKKSQPSP